MPIEIANGYLPPDISPYTVAIPTYERWGKPVKPEDGGPQTEVRGSLPTTLATYDAAIQRAGIAPTSRFLIADGSSKTTHEERARWLQSYYDKNGGSLQTPTFILTHNGQTRLVDQLEEKLNKQSITRDLLERISLDPSCGGNRHKVAVIAAAAVDGTPNSFVLGLVDDDIDVPYQYEKVGGYGRIYNGQVIVDMRRNGHLQFDRAKNGNIATDFLDIPGKTIQELKGRFPEMQASETWKDTMHRQLDEAQRNGVAIFEVNPDGESIENGTVWGISAIKSGKPDYRTAAVLKQFLMDEFPEEELPILSFPASPNKMFAIRKCGTNVDAAMSAWHVDEDTSRLPFSFIISPEISGQGKYGTVGKIRTRADNELLPGMADEVYQRTGKSLLYATGPNFQVKHTRDSSGYRPNIVDQACTSLVDNLYAQAANELMEYNDMHASMDSQAIDAYTIPEDRAHKVFDTFQEFALICENKRDELSQRNTHSTEEEKQLMRKIDMYTQIHQTFKRKLGVLAYEQENNTIIPTSQWEDVAFNQWKKAIDDTGRRQLHYFNTILVTTPIVVEATKDILRGGRYPAAYVVPEGAPSVSLPNQATVYQR